jgi:hypothetical protein
MAKAGTGRDLEWRKARRCDGGACVEVAKLGESVMLRNPEDPGVILVTDADEWLRFISQLKEIFS